MNRVLQALVVAVAFPVWAGAQTPACSCPASSGHAVKDLSRYKSAFAGRVSEIDGSKVSFEILRVYKGARSKTLVLSAGAQGCSFSFEKGQSYLVYANGEKDSLSTDNCAPNRALGAATAELRQLDLHTGQAASPLRVASH